MTEVLAIAKLIGAFMLIGGALFRRLIWSTLSHDREESLSLVIVRRSTRLMISGATIFVLVALLDMPLPAKQAAVSNVLPLALAPLFVATFLAGEARKSPVFANLAVLTGLLIIACLSFTSHAAAEPGLLAIASNFLHWIAALVWGGCLMHLSLLPWSGIRRDCEQGNMNMRPLVRRYANLAIGALGLMALSGGLLAFIHVHNADAMHTTLYGRFVIVKASLAALLIVTVSINVLRVSRIRLRRFARLIIVETVLLGGLLVATGNLETRNPPGVPPFNNPKSWQMRAAEVPLTLNLQPVGGSSTQARIEISAATPDYRFDDGARAFFSLYSLTRDAGQHDIEAVWIGPSGFLGETVLAVPGEWKFELRVEYPDGSSLAGDSVLVLPALPLEEDLKAFLSFSAIIYSLPGLVTFVVGMLLLITAGWLLRQSWHAMAPSWLMPVSMANIVLGGYLALSVTFVKTYPTTFWSNPEPYSADVIREGETVYREHCAECHGITGKGDGPWAIEERGSIPDLAAPHMDVHTDGEVYWWIIKGIPSLDKPPLAEALSETDRWAVINYTRSLRHGMPSQ